jgi:hypothetical protein
MRGREFLISLWRNRADELPCSPQAESMAVRYSCRRSLGVSLFEATGVKISAIVRLIGLNVVKETLL